MKFPAENICSITRNRMQTDFWIPTLNKRFFQHWFLRKKDLQAIWPPTHLPFHIIHCKAYFLEQFEGDCVVGWDRAVVSEAFFVVWISVLDALGWVRAGGQRLVFSTAAAPEQRPHSSHCVWLSSFYGLGNNAAWHRNSPKKTSLFALFLHCYWRSSHGCK